MADSYCVFDLLFYLAHLLQILVTASSNLILRHWDWNIGVVTRSWKVLLSVDVYYC